MPLSTRPALVLFQNGVDGSLPRAQLRAPDRLLPPIPRWRWIRQHLPHRLAGQPELPCHFALTPPLHMNCPPYPCIQFHGVHASGVPQNTRLSTAPNLIRHPWNAPVVCGTKCSGGLLLLRHVTLLSRRDVVYFH